MNARYSDVICIYRKRVTVKEKPPSKYKVSNHDNHLYRGVHWCSTPLVLLVYLAV